MQIATRTNTHTTPDMQVATRTYRPFPFLDLPTELRLMVYEKTGTVTRYCRLEQYEERREEIRAVGDLILVIESLDVSIFATCRTIYSESSVILKRLRERRRAKPLRLIFDGWSPEYFPVFYEPAMQVVARLVRTVREDPQSELCGYCVHDYLRAVVGRVVYPRLSQAETNSLLNFADTCTHHILVRSPVDLIVVISQPPEATEINSDPTGLRSILKINSAEMCFAVLGLRPIGLALHGYFTDEQINHYQTCQETPTNIPFLGIIDDDEWRDVWEETKGVWQQTEDSRVLPRRLRFSQFTTAQEITAQLSPD